MDTVTSTDKAGVELSEIRHPGPASCVALGHTPHTPHTPQASVASPIKRGVVKPLLQGHDRDYDC